MKKSLVIAATLVLALAGCSSQAAEEAEDTSTDTTYVEEEAVSEDQGDTIEWTDATTAEEAAKGAGFEKFGVLASFKIGDIEFANPTFSYAGGVAQATYENPACAVYLRKAEGYYTTPLSDRALDAFSNRWHKTDVGIDIACHGEARGAVTVATWTDGNKSYGLTYQGLGGDEMSMDSDEALVLVRGINEANADQTDADEEAKKAAEAAEAAKKVAEAQAQSSLISQADADALVEKTSGGECTALDRVTTKQYGDCWYAVSLDSAGVKREYYVNNDGIYLISETQTNASSSNSSSSSSSNKSAHYEGEPVTIYSNIYAEWHKVNDGTWYAVFITYNGTQIFAQEAPAGGGWVFYAISGGKSIQVIYSDMESSAEGKYGPKGLSSHWIELDGDRWF